MKFRPCIDLHQGKVKQVVGSTFEGQLITNFVAPHPPSWYAQLYQKDVLCGGHVIMLGSGNEEAAIEAIQTWPNGLQIGGGINENNAKDWIDRGAQAVIVTSAVFRNGQVDFDRLLKLKQQIGKERLILDLSCRRRGDDYFVVTDLWTRFTDVKIEPCQLDKLSQHCAEFLIHAVDVEGKGLGIDVDLLHILGSWKKHPMTYAGGIHSQEDIQAVKTSGQGEIDFTVGSALDIFGGSGLKYQDLVAKNMKGF